MKEDMRNEHDKAFTSSTSEAVDVKDLTEAEIYDALDVDWNGETATSIISEHAGAFAKIDQYVRDIASSEALPWTREVKDNGEIEFHGGPLSKYSSQLGYWVGVAAAEGLLPEPFEVSGSPSEEAALLEATLSTQIKMRRSEAFRLFSDACRELDMQGMHYERPHLRQPDGRFRYDVENKLVELIRSGAKSKPFITALTRRKEQTKRRQVSGADFFDKAFDRCSDLLVVRLDVGYRKDFTGEITLARAQRDIEKLWNNRRSKKYKKTFEWMIGYIRKLEYTPHKRFHYHLLLVFNGHKVEKGYHYANEIGKFWVERVTNGQGVFHNCHQTKRPYLECGIGPIHVSDHIKRGFLLKHGVGYLAKKDQYLKLPLEKVRSFQTSLLAPRKSAAGRPRLNRDGK